jgi:hypothetical protein
MQLKPIVRIRKRDTHTWAGTEGAEQRNKRGEEGKKGG